MRSRKKYDEINKNKKLNNDFYSEFCSIQRMIPYSETNYATHYLHRYPAKFIPHFPRLFIKHFLHNNEGIILDPMCGSGTTLIESCIAGYKSIGVEIDPISYLIAKVATTPLHIEKIKINYETFLKEIEQDFKKNLQQKLQIPNEKEFPNAFLWFREDIFNELIYIRNKIFKLRDKDFRDFLLLSLSSIIRGVSNADPRDIFPQRDKDLLVRERKNVIVEFKSALDSNIDAISDFLNRKKAGSKCQVIKGDARSLNILDSNVDFVFTSPPYSYAMDYARINKLSTLLLLMSNEELKEYRRLYVGTDRIKISEFSMVNGHFPSYEGFEFAGKEIESLYKTKKRLGIYLYKYFVDMHKITKEIYRILKPQCYLVYVVGNSTINRTHFFVDKVFQSICENVGFVIEDVLERKYYAYRMARKRNIQSNTIKKDIFIIARK